MRLLKIVILVIFLITSVVYGVIFAREKLSEDNQAPEIRADADEITVSVNATESELLQGMSANDNKDGDVTDSLVVVSQLDFITKGTRKMNYAAFESHNNVATYTRTVTYSDYRSPHISSTIPFHFVYSGTTSSSNLFSQVRADDVLDGDLTASIRVVYGAANEAGTVYPVVLNVTNSAGDTATVSINVYREDNATYAIPSPALSDYIVYTQVSQPINPWDYVKGYYTNGKLIEFSEKSRYTWDNIDWDASGVNYDTPGEYIMTYRMYGNGEEGELRSVEQYIIVEG